jgi:hypothetical protein
MYIYIYIYIFIYICIFFACAALPQPRNSWKYQPWRPCDQRQEDGGGGGGGGGSGAQSSMDRWHGDPAPEIQGAIDAVSSVQQSAAATVQHQINALITTMGCQQNDLVQSLALQNNQHHMNLVATIVTAITQATRAADRQRPMAAASQQPPQELYQAPYQGAESQGSAQDGGWYWWSAMDMAGHPQTRPVWNGNTNDRHADNWAADAVWPDNTQAYADGSNTQAADNNTQAADAGMQMTGMPDIPMTGMQMMGPAGWPAAVVPVVPVVQVDAVVPVVQVDAVGVPVVQVDASPAPAKQDEDH